jgi:cytochrome c
MRAALALLLLSAGGALGSAAAADAERGADVFDSNCAECHSVAKSLKNKKGPSLFGIVGRPAGSVAGFDYSEALLGAGFRWDDTHLDRYLIQPKALVPGGKMKFDGLAKADERADLIAFLAEQK